MKAFISYSSADQEFARRLALDLQKHGVIVWLDEWEIKVGDEIRQQIEHGIAEYDYFVIVLSRHSVASTWVEKELNAAFMKEVNTNRIVVLPVRLEDCAIPPLISGKKYADFTMSYQYGLQELLKVFLPSDWSIPKKTSSRLIVVDDDLTFANSIADALGRIGISVSVTYSPRAALELAKRYKPDTVLVDVWFSSEGEFTPNLASELRNTCPGIRIVGLTGSPEIRPEVSKGFDNVLMKPITIQELISVLNIAEEGKLNNCA